MLVFIIISHFGHTNYLSGWPRRCKLLQTCSRCSSEPGLYIVFNRLSCCLVVKQKIANKSCILKLKTSVHINVIGMQNNVIGMQEHKDRYVNLRKACTKSKACQNIMTGILTSTPLTLRILCHLKFQTFYTYNYHTPIKVTCMFCFSQQNL